MGLGFLPQIAQEQEAAGDRRLLLRSLLRAVYETVAQLRARGFKMSCLEDGLPEWRAAGLPMVEGNG
jgi:ArsR family transcriptional regulator